MTRLPPIFVVTLVGALAALSVMKVRFSSDLYSLLPADLPEVRGMKELEDFFGHQGQLIVTIEGSEAWAVEEAGASLARHLRAQSDSVSNVFREVSIENLVTEGADLLAWTWLNASPDEFRDLSRRLQAEHSGETISSSLAAVHDPFATENSLVASYDPLNLRRAASLDSRTNPMRAASGLFEVLYVDGQGADFTDYRAAAVWLDAIRESVATWQQSWAQSHDPEASIQIGLTGTPAFMAEVGSEMERDMTVSVLLTLSLISLLFFLMHRQLRPLAWLMSAMLAVLTITINLGALLFGELSVMSVGFAAILMGLAVDYGIILYREAIDSGKTARALRRTVGPSIIWAAASTALVFLSLNLSSLPGLTEMGNLVSLGVVIGALVMLFLFLPVAVAFGQLRPAAPLSPRSISPRSTRWAVAAGLLVPVTAAAAVSIGEIPRLEPNFHPFRIRESASVKAWQTLQAALRGPQHTVPAIVTGDDLAGLHETLERLETRLINARENGLIDRFLLPTAWIPNPQHQLRNRSTLQDLLGEKARLLAELDEAGFSKRGSSLTKSVFSSWEDSLDSEPEGGIVLPQGEMARWSVGRVFAGNPDKVAALVSVTPAAPASREWVHAITNENTSVASLSSLGTALNERIRRDLTKVFLPIAVLLALMLAIVFRSWKDLTLSLMVLAFSGAALLLFTETGILHWNSFNICGLLLLLGIGLDFGIHMIFALRRCGGDIAQARRRMGKALLFCGSSSAIGFGSLAAASAHGLSSLGIVCAVGILTNMVVAIVLLPHWYRWLHRLGDSWHDNRLESV